MVTTVSTREMVGSADSVKVKVNMMQNKSLGLIEVIGLTAAVEAADAAAKSADVELLGYETTNGGGWLVVKLAGDVSSVEAAVQAGRCAAERVGTVIASHVIARMGDGLEALLGPSAEEAPPTAAEEAAVAAPTDEKAAQATETPPQAVEATAVAAPADEKAAQKTEAALSSENAVPGKALETSKAPGKPPAAAKTASKSKAEKPVKDATAAAKPLKASTSKKAGVDVKRAVSVSVSAEPKKGS